MTRLRSIGIGALAAILLSACGTGAATTDGADAAGPPQSGGTLRFAVGSDAGCLDPQQVASNDSIYSVRQTVDSLTDQDPETGEIVPWLAESWEVNADATAYTFTLREGVTFSDGTPLDAAAVAANFDRVPQIGVRGSLPKSYLASYAGATAVTPLQVEVRFDQPNVQFLQGTSTHSLGILSPASVAATDDERCAGVVGSGPFVLGEYLRDESLTLTRRTGYDWGSSLWEHTGEAYLDELRFDIVPESGVRVGSLQSGEVDAIGTIGPQDEAPLTSAGVQLPSRANPGIPIGLTFNNGSGPTADPAVRAALSFAIDREQVADVVFTTDTPAATSVLSSTTPGYAAQDALLAHDPQQAAAGLDAAGWVPGADGIRERNGERLAITVVYFDNYAPSRPALELIQQQVRTSGIELVLQQAPITDGTRIQQEGSFGAIFSGLTRADADVLRTQYSTALANVYRVQPSPVDELLVAQAGAADPAARADLVAQAQQGLLEAHVSAPVVELVTTLGVSPDVHGLRFDASSRISLHDTWKSA